MPDLAKPSTRYNGIFYFFFFNLRLFSKNIGAQSSTLTLSETKLYNLQSKTTSIPAPFTWGAPGMNHLCELGYRSTCWRKPESQATTAFLIHDFATRSVIKRPKGHGGRVLLISLSFKVYRMWNRGRVLNAQSSVVHKCCWYSYVMTTYIFQ